MYSSRSNIFAKLKVLNNDTILVRETKECCQLVLRGNLRNIVCNELHNKMGHLGTDKVFDLARRRFYWRKMYRNNELCQEFGGR